MKSAAEHQAAPVSGKPGKTDAVSLAQANSELSAESIGWMFIQKYYESLAGDMSELFGFYDASAAVLHEEFPDETSDKASKTVHEAHGHESIQALFEGQMALAASAQLEKNKIVVENATFQDSVDNSILIVVSGSWKRGLSHLWQFAQTFVLLAKEKTVYNIANDVLKFADLFEEYKEICTTQIVEVIAKPAEARENGKSEGRINENAGSEPEAKPESDVEADVQETQVEGEEKPSVSEETEPTKESSTPQNEQPHKEEPVAAVLVPAEKKEAAKLPVPAQKPTWANLAAIGPKAAAKNTAVVSLGAAKPVPAAFQPAGAAVAAAKKAVSPNQVSPQNSVNGKYKKEEWYPIYIKNIDVEEDELKAAIIEQLGEIKFFKRTNRTALCDFRNKEDQQRALEMRELMVNNNVVLLEQKTHKPYNNGKPEAKKDKKYLKKPAFKKN